MVITETSKETGEPTMLENGADVIAYTEFHPRGNGWKRHGVALCRRDDSYEPFVVWTVYENTDGDYVEWHAENGNYCCSILTAVRHYEQRGGI